MIESSSVCCTDEEAEVRELGAHVCTLLVTGFLTCHRGLPVTQNTHPDSVPWCLGVIDAESAPLRAEYSGLEVSAPLPWCPSLAPENRWALPHGGLAHVPSENSHLFSSDSFQLS